MKYGPPNGGGPVPERNLRVAEQCSRTPSEGGPASPTPSASQAVTAPRVQLDVILEVADHRCTFEAYFNGVTFSGSSKSPGCAAACALDALGYPDQATLILRDDGADHQGMQGPLGLFFKVLP